MADARDAWDAEPVEDRIAHLEVEVAAKVAALQAHGAALEHMVAELRASTPWRVSAPLRKISRLLRKRRAPRHGR